MNALRQKTAAAVFAVSRGLAQTSAALDRFAAWLNGGGGPGPRPQQ